MQVVEGKFVFSELKSGDRTWQVVVESLGDLSLEDIRTDKEAFLYTVYGQTNKIQSAKTQIKGKNIGKSNETKNLEQAIKQAQSMISKKKQAGYSEEASTKEVLFPMAVSPFDPKKIKFPCLAQAKLDGIRMIAADKLLSRKLHEISGFDHVKEETDILLREIPECIFIDGELYNHNMALQEISGIVRSSEEAHKKKLFYYVFDICVKGLGFKDRFNLLKTAFEKFNFRYLRLLDAKHMENQEEADEFYQSLVDDSYEGLIYKQCDSPYETGGSKEKRSTKCVKRKVSLEEEFAIIAYNDGVGKYEGCVVFTLKTNEGLEFQCVPLGSMEKRRELYESCLEDFSKFENKLATVRFDAWSSSKVPLRGVIVNIDRID